MDNFDQAESIQLENEENEEKNEFLDEKFQYEQCPNCDRRFFVGKLKCHLNLCKPSHPMTKSPLRKIKRQYILNSKARRIFSHDGRFEIIDQKSKEKKRLSKCQFCKVNIPSYLITNHEEKCKNDNKLAQNQSSEKQAVKSNTKIDFNNGQQVGSVILPRIQNSAKEKKFSQRRREVSDIKELGQYTVKIREDLSCFRKALQVKKIQCEFCGRKFSRQASLRHIPICQKLKFQEKSTVVVRKHCKSQLYAKNKKPVSNAIFRKQRSVNDRESSDSKMVSQSLKTARIFKIANTKQLQTQLPQRKDSKMDSKLMIRNARQKKLQQPQPFNNPQITHSNIRQALQKNIKPKLSLIRCQTDGDEKSENKLEQVLQIQESQVKSAQKIQLTN